MGQGEWPVGAVSGQVVHRLPTCYGPLSDLSSGLSSWRVFFIRPPSSACIPALCGSHPLVTPYYCRLGDLLCFVFIVSLLYFFCELCNLCVPSVVQYFDTVGWVLWPVKNRCPYNLYCVGGDIKPCSINQSACIQWSVRPSTTPGLTEGCWRSGEMWSNLDDVWSGVHHWLEPIELM